MAFKHSAFIQSDLTVENDLNRNSRYHTRLQFCLSARHGAKRIMGKNKKWCSFLSGYTIFFFGFIDSTFLALGHFFDFLFFDFLLMLIGLIMISCAPIGSLRDGHHKL